MRFNGGGAFGGSPLRNQGRSTSLWPLMLVVAILGLFLSQRMLIYSASSSLLENYGVATVSDTRDAEFEGKKGFAQVTATSDKPKPAPNPSILRRMDRDSQILLDTANDETETIHITHVFSTFSAPSSSPAFVEQMVVQEAWKRAAMEAKRTRGLNIQFIDNILPGDDACSPPFAQRVNMSWWLMDVKKGKVPTVGENFHIAKERGRGELMMFTNADIAVMPDFYGRAWDWYKKDLLTPESQLEAMQATSRYMGTCFFNLGFFGRNGLPVLHYETCVEDAKVFYIHSGGFKELWEEVKLDIALHGAKQRRKLDKDEVTMVKYQEMVETFQNNGVKSTRVKELLEQIAAAEDWRPFVESFTMQPPSELLLSGVPKPLFAGTVTRMDLDVVINTSLPEWQQSPAKLYQQALGSVTKLGVRHPGNDCFLFHRDHLPDGARKMGHPAGVRPFGLFLALSWWDSPHPYRRITATKKNPWTFHVGIGLWGMDSIPWKERAHQDPTYTLFLAANYDRMSHGNFQRMFQGPRVCQNSTTPWRSVKFCNSISNEFCAGIVRFSCYYKFHYSLRDAMWYYDTCSQLHHTLQGKMKNPVCDFCNFMFKSRPAGSRKRFTCEAGKMRFCKGLPNEICPDEESILGEGGGRVEDDRSSQIGSSSERDETEEDIVEGDVDDDA